MKPFLPPKLAPIVFGFFVSGLMTFIVSGISTLNAIGIGIGDVFIDKWLSAWGASWIVAFPVIIFVAPITQKLIKKMTKIV